MDIDNVQRDGHPEDKEYLHKSQNTHKPEETSLSL